MAVWELMNEQARLRASDLSAADISSRPGVYALYVGDEPLYVGKAANLRSRLWNNHLRQSASMTNSALRRNIAAHLGIASAADIKTRRYAPTADDARRVSEWIRACDIAWIECESEADALALEAKLKNERKPPLTKL